MRGDGSERRRTSILRARPVGGDARPPQYPRRDDLSTGGESAGPRWRKAAGGAATFFLAISIGGCEQPCSPPSGNQQIASSRQSQHGSIVAPVFEHGIGRGVYGCVVMNPPTFLSEEEAMLIIKEELGKRGITLGRGGELRGATLETPLKRMLPKDEEHRRMFGGDRKGHKEPFLVDAIDSHAGVAVEYISMGQCSRLDPCFAFGSVSSYRTREVASALSNAAAEQGPPTMRLGVFYDPVRPVVPGEKKAVKELQRIAKDSSLTEKEKKEAEEKVVKPLEAAFKEIRDRDRIVAKDLSKKLLRKQVQDFAEWLDKQGDKKDG